MERRPLVAFEERAAPPIPIVAPPRFSVASETCANNRRLSDRSDGKRLYTLRSAYYNVTPSPPLADSLESDGLSFAPYSYEGTAQTFFQGPVQMRFDERERVLYSAHWETGGLWALRAVGF